MGEQQEISPFIRVVSGVLGLLGIAAIPVNAVVAGEIQPAWMLVASLFAGFVFLYVAFFGKYPWNPSAGDE